MRTVFLASITFALFKALPAFILPLTALLTQRPARPDVLGDLLLVGYLIGVSTGLATVGFAVSTALSGFWRRLPIRRAAVIAGVSGVVSPVATVLVALVTAPAVLPLFRSATSVAFVVFYGLPGIVLGIAAVLAARLWDRRARRRSAAKSLADPPA